MKNKFIITLFLTALLISGKWADAQTYPLSSGEKVGAFTLSQILDSIDTNNPGLQQFDFKTQASYAMGEAAKAWMAPTAGAGLSEFPYASAGKMNDNGMMPRKMLMLRLQQMFPNFSQQRKEEAYYRSYANQHQDDRETTKNLLFARAKMAYYDAYVAAKKLGIISEQEKQLKLLIQIAEGRLAYDKAFLPNIYKARAKLSDLQSMHIKLQSIGDQAVAVLNSLMNNPVDTPLQIDTATDVLKQGSDILQVDSLFVQRHRSDIQHIGDEMHSMQLEAEVVSAMNKPTFGLIFDNMRMPVSSGAKGGSMYMYNAMAMISIPIAPWFSKGYKSKVHSIDYQIQAMRKMQEGQVQQTLGSIRKDWLNLQSARKELKLFQTAVIPAYAKTFQSNLNAFSENTGDIYETLTAWNDLTLKKMEYYEKLGDLLNIRVMLETEMQVY